MPLKVISLKLDQELLEEIEMYARKRGISRSAAIRQAIESLLLDEEKQPISKPISVEAGVKVVRLRIEV